MGEGRSSGSREMTHGAEEVEGEGGGGVNRTSEQVNILHILPRFLFMV